ncbi:hypothetical protein CSV72_09485 [Sporosarcina sp. P20a]|uniref:DUF4179 domain-containing protein n=1 Tax=Sporosarcina sp. P20a TaxID=2048256 RepID=UPI000C172789|nr:DUF4179 domain-containing protein [Sporosarcina sp. P20a]PIC86210.1 hypothetical protein CSV72_09485 [Sporosarcina sp. P20a]
MYETEEERLKQLKERLDQQPLPLSKADQAIRQGVERVRQEKRRIRKRRKRILGSVAVIALLLLTFITSIRVSPVFANVVASIPGMEKFVELIAMDKGLNAAIQNDYYQEIGVTQTIQDKTLTIDGVILDETGMNIFYTIDSERPLTGLRVDYINLKAEGMPEGSFSYGNMMDEEEVYTYKDRIDYQFGELYTSQDQSFDLKVATKLKGEETVFSVPFTVPKQVKPSEVYTIEKEVEIAGQKFTIEKVTVSPLRVGVKITIDSANPMKILQFEDMRLEDEKGEVWGSIQNGTTAFGGEDGESTLFLQSNYFSKPEKLYLRINKVQALKAEEAIAEINTETGDWLNQPEDQKIQLVKSDKSHAEFIMVKADHPSFQYDFASAISDAKGIEMHSPSVGMYSSDSIKHWDISFSPTDYTNPLKLEIFAYPNYLEGDIKIELK